MNMTLAFVIVIAIALTVTLVMSAQSFGVKLSDHYPPIVAVTAVAAAAIVIYKLRFRIAFAGFSNKSIDGSDGIGHLLGLQSVTIQPNYILATNGKKLVGHAYFRITNIPYLLDDLDKEKKMWSVGNFVRLLSSLNFPFELIPRIMPVPASVYLNQINKEINDLKTTLNAEGNLASPKRQARLRYLEKMATRLLEGEGTRDVSFLCHIMVEGSNEPAIVRELEANAKTLMSALESGLNVRAERLTGARMLEVLREFFRASVKVNPRKANRMLTWDLAYLIPLAKPKLPPLEKLLSGVYLGRTVGNGLVCLDIKRYANPHVLVLGKSGYGKSTTVKTLTARMFDLWETSILIIDYAGEYAPWVRSRSGTVIDMQVSGINPFDLGSATLTDRMRQLMDTFQVLSELSLPQRNILSYYLVMLYESKGFRAAEPSSWKREVPTLEELVDLMKRDLDESKVTKQMTVMTLVEKLSALSSGPLGISRKSTFSVSNLTRGFVCIDLSKVTSTMMKDMIAYTVLQHVDSEMRLKGMVQGVRLAIVLDEAWKLCRDEQSLPVTIIKEGRKYGYSLIVSSQDATADLAESILANAGMVLIHHTEHPKYLKFFEQAYGLTSSELSRIKNAPIGEALAKIGDDPRPFFVRVEMEDVQDGKQATMTAKATVRDDFADSANISAPLAVPAEISAPNNPVKLSYYARKILKNVAERPDKNVTNHYNYLGINPREGNKAKKELETLGLIEEIELPSVVGYGRSGKVLRLTSSGYSYLGKKPDTNRFGGPVHRHLVRLIKTKYSDRGVGIESPLGEGKLADLVIDDRIAVEVETRDFSEENIRKNLAAGYEKVIFVCPTKQQAAKFRSILAEKFPAETRVIIADIATILKNPIEVL